MATVREIRKTRGMSQQDLADRAHIGRATLYRLERGGQANEATWYAIAQALEVQLKDITGVNVVDRSRRVVP